MKKQLLAGAFVLASFLTAQAQVLHTENFNDATVGNVGTDLTGASAGQADFFTATVVGDNSDFQIVANGKDGNGFQITAAADASGTTQATDNTRYAWQNGLNDAWLASDPANGAISIDFDFYTPAATEGTTNNHRISLYHFVDQTTANVLGGYLYDAATGELRGLATYTNTSGQSGLFNFTLSAATGGVVLTANTWYKVAITYVPSTGQVIWSSNDITVTYQDGSTGLLNAAATSSNNVGLDPHELDFIAVAGENNAASTSVIYDNIRARAIASNEEILGAKPVVGAIAELSVYPNPVNDVVNISVDALVSNVAIVDLNGRTVKTAKFDGVSNASVNVSDLASGVYMMTITSDKGTTTKKIVKN